jgi:hypothetical protein
MAMEIVELLFNDTKTWLPVATVHNKSSNTGSTKVLIAYAVCLTV